MQEPMTAYLGFKVAIRVNDRDLAERCLEVIGQSKDHIEYLAACIAESQKAEDIQSAVSGLKRLHLKYAQKASPGKIHLPALFRSSIRLLHVLLVSPMYPERKAEFVNQLCQEFGSGKFPCLAETNCRWYDCRPLILLILLQPPRLSSNTTIPLTKPLRKVRDRTCSRSRSWNGSASMRTISGLRTLRTGTCDP